MAFSDVDLDGDDDVLLTGADDTSVTAKLYSNDGNGVFSEVSGTPFRGVSRSSVAFSDVDGDGDGDVLITGEDSLFTLIAKLYTNNGSGVFTEVAGTPFEGVYDGSVAFSDVDDDGDSDVLITGTNSSFTVIAKLYANNGSGVFTEMTGDPFIPVSSGSVAFSDVDGDGDSDVLLTGGNGLLPFTSILYLNDGNGAFAETGDAAFEGTAYGSAAFSDVDNDGDSDVLITGETNSGSRITKLYTNNGSGVFAEVAGTPFTGLWECSAAFSDVDGDGDADVLIAGENNSFVPVTRLYRNNGPITSVEQATGAEKIKYVLYPNPVTSGQLTLAFEADRSAPWKIALYSSEGNFVQSWQSWVTGGHNSINLNIPVLEPGLYQVQATDGKNNIVAKFLIP